MKPKRSRIKILTNHTPWWGVKTWLILLVLFCLIPKREVSTYGRQACDIQEQDREVSIWYSTFSFWTKYDAMVAIHQVLAQTVRDWLYARPLGENSMCHYAAITWWVMIIGTIHRSLFRR
jgi:hypothetical protein